MMFQDLNWGSKIVLQEFYFHFFYFFEFFRYFFIFHFQTLIKLIQIFYFVQLFIERYRI